MDKLVLIRPDDPNPEDAGECRDCGTKAEWEKLDRGGFMGKETWITTLREGLCEKCFQVFNSNREKADAERKKQQAEEKRFKRLVELLGGERPAREWNWEKADPNFNRGLYRVMKAFDPTKQNLFVHGITGLGKTVLATAIARKVLDDGGRAYVIGMMKLNAELQAWAMDGAEVSYIEKLAVYDVLVIDDLGRGRPTDFKIDSICAILEARYYKEKKGLIITSNLNLDGLAEIFSNRLASRIVGMCKEPDGQIIEGRGEDIRLKVIG